MDTEKSSSSSFEDLSNVNASEYKTSEIFEADQEAKGDGDSSSQQIHLNTTDRPTKASLNIPEGDDTVCDILGNGQLIKRVLRSSTTKKRPDRGELVTINIKGLLDDGTLVEEESDFQIHVGDYEVVQGLDMAIPLINFGEVAEVVVNSRFAYGTLGLKNSDKKLPSIPPNATITYEVELLDTKYEDFADLKSFELRRKHGNRKKERGNFWYNRNEFNIAIQLYRRALDYLDDRDGDPDAKFGDEDLELSNDQLQLLLEDRLVVYNNLAMAQIKILAYDAALKSVENVLRCQPNNSKALYRKGRILDGKGDTKAAISLLQRAATLEPESAAIKQDLAKLIIKSRREEHNEKEMYQKMLGQAKKLEQKHKQPHKQHNIENSKLKLLGYIMGSILIGVAGVAIYRYKY